MAADNLNPGCSGNEQVSCVSKRPPSVYSKVASWTTISELEFDKIPIYFRGDHIALFSQWADREISIAWRNALKAIEGDSKARQFIDYCYDDALTLFNDLMIHFVSEAPTDHARAKIATILMSLLLHKPLSPIEDFPDEWDCLVKSKKDDPQRYRSKRVPSLFKTVYPDGRITYADECRCTCVNVNNPKSRHYDGIETQVINEVINDMFPIQMPYIPNPTSWQVGYEMFLSEGILKYSVPNYKMNTLGILYMITPNGQTIPIHRYFKLLIDIWFEIDESEYTVRKTHRVD
jgi:hypothetical protein